MTTKLIVFNDALRILGQPQLASVDHPGEDGTQLRAAWESVIKGCYEVGNWNFLMTRAALSRAVEVPIWGYSYYYTLPIDYSRLAEINQTGIPGDALLDYEMEKGKVATNADTVYIRYVSTNIVSITPGDWTQAFADFVAATLALRVCPKLNAGALDLADGMVKSSRVRALSIDAIANPPARRRQGNWASANRGGGRRSQEHG